MRQFIRWLYIAIVHRHWRSRGWQPLEAEADGSPSRPMALATAIRRRECRVLSYEDMFGGKRP